MYRSAHAARLFLIMVGQQSSRIHFECREAFDAIVHVKRSSAVPVDHPQGWLFDEPQRPTRRRSER